MLTCTILMTHNHPKKGPGDAGLNNVAANLINVSMMSRAGNLAGLPGKVGIGMHKAQGGATAEALAMFDETSQNPVLKDAVGAIMSQWRVPSLPQLAPSVAVLQTLWPRLQKYAITSKADKLYPICEAGAATAAPPGGVGGAGADGGNATAARLCLSEWQARIPSIVAELNAMKAALFENFPPRNGYSGSYWNEADYYEKDWQTSFWGEANYPKLLIIKQKYDPNGLFTCHHCVGSESWSTDGNCKLY